MDSGRFLLGRLADVSVREWLESHKESIARLPYVLISVMDSERSVATMPWAINRRASMAGWALSVTPLVITGAAVVELLEDDGLLTGFDELWFPESLPVEEPPGNAYLVGPRELDLETPPGVVAWLEESRCRLGVGDGSGLNYAVTDATLAEELGLA